jgi:hypothetical protein
LRSNTKGYGGKTHYIDLQNSDTTALWGHRAVPFTVLAPGTFGYTLSFFGFVVLGR